jgi:hypothetical protein
VDTQQFAALMAATVDKLIWFSAGLGVGVALEWQFHAAIESTLRRLWRWTGYESD